MDFAFDNDDNATLGLNIVAVPLQKSVKAKPKKRQNKYEKRRRRAQQANHHDDDATKQHVTTKKNVNGTTAPDVTYRKIVEEAEAADSLTLEASSVSVDDSTNVEEVEHEDDLQYLPHPDNSTDDKNNDNTFFAEPEHDNSRDTSQAFPDDTEERSKYLAEFHARPMELDRRAGARSTIRASNESQHLFATARTWSQLGLHPRLVACVESQFKSPTTIQTRAIPAFAVDSAAPAAATAQHNLLIHSETGSGKTLAYLLPILQSLLASNTHNRASAGTRCVILCPTRELASQTFAVAERTCARVCHSLVAGLLTGDERRKSEKARVRKGLAIVVATPGRFLDHLTRTESLMLALKGKLEWLVLDEADRILDLGLGDQVKQIVQRIRANQPGSGVTWRSVLLSATITINVELLAKETLIGGNNQWVWLKGGDAATNTEAILDEQTEFADSTPRQLSQSQMTVSAKLRLPALVAFLTHRVKRRERTVVFMSTCASVDFYYSLFEAMDSILKNNEDSDSSSGIFGNRCAMYRLHGSVPHSERQHILKRFAKETIKDSGAKRASILFATDVAARGLNMPDVDWAVQYDPPCEVSDYVHRIGRVGRAGAQGHSLLFLLPSEAPFLDVLKKRGVKNIAALSLASTLNTAATLCESLTQDGVRRSGGGLGDSRTSSRAGEAFCCELQRRLEECVELDNVRTKAAHKEALKKQQRKKAKPEEACGELLDKARAAFLSHLRAYPTKEKLIRTIFSAKSLHYGHIARSFALKEPPKKLVNKTTRGGKPMGHTDKESNKRNNASMTFESLDNDGQVIERSTINKKAKYGDIVPPRQAKALLLANAAKLQQNGMDTM
jgi:ATP-dependent RNA helicase DDX31/DBP7